MVFVLQMPMQQRQQVPHLVILYSQANMLGDVKIPMLRQEMQV